MSIYFNNIEINTLNLGSTEISEVYMGTNKIWPFGIIEDFDPYWENVILLLPCDDEAESITFEDKSLIGNIVTSDGGTKVKEDVPKFGSGCMTSDGIGGDVNTIFLDNDVHINGSEDWTIEMWVGYPDFSYNDYSVFDLYGSAINVRGSYDTWSLIINNVTTIFSHQIPFPGLNEWKHMAFERHGSTTSFYINGELAASGNSVDITGTGGDSVLCSGPGNGWIARYDDWRVTKDIARYKGPFTKPTRPHPIFVPPTYSEIILTNNPVAYYRMDEKSGTDINDISGNNNDGTVNGTIIFDKSSAVELADDSSIEFTNTGTIDLPAELGSATDNSFSLECWAKFTASGNCLTFVNVASGTNKASLTCGRSGTHTIGFIVGEGVSDGGVANWYYDAGAPINDDEWHHLVAVWDGTAKIYIDAVDTSYLSNGSAYISGTNKIGGGYYGGMTGDIDEVAIYDTALTQEQITKHYNKRYRPPNEVKISTFNVSAAYNVSNAVSASTFNVSAAYNVSNAVSASTFNVSSVHSVSNSLAVSTFNVSVAYTNLTNMLRISTFNVCDAYKVNNNLRISTFNVCDAYKVNNNILVSTFLICDAYTTTDYENS
jgi:hypothetical protein